MAEIRTVTTLARKAAEIEKVIAQYEARLAQARADLAAVNATIVLFNGEAENLSPYERSHRLLGRGEALPLVLDALRCQSPLSTRQLALAIMDAKGLDTGDTVLVRAFVGRYIAIAAGRVAFLRAVGGNHPARLPLFFACTFFTLICPGTPEGTKVPIS